MSLRPDAELVRLEARRDQIVELARTLTLAQGVDQQSAIRGRPDSCVLQSSVIYRAGSYRELERRMDEMRLRDETIRLRWHFAHRYVWAERRPRPARTTATNTLEVLWEEGWTPVATATNWQPAGGIHSRGLWDRYVMVEAWHPGVLPERVTAALDWLEERMPATIRVPDWQRFDDRERAA